MASIFVPILTQSENWALWYGVVNNRIEGEFQSSPSPKTGRYPAGIVTGAPAVLVFQSSPSPKTGRYSKKQACQR